MVKTKQKNYYKLYYHLLKIKIVKTNQRKKHLSIMENALVQNHFATLFIYVVLAQ